MSDKEEMNEETLLVLYPSMYKKHALKFTLIAFCIPVIAIIAAFKAGDFPFFEAHAELIRLICLIPIPLSLFWVFCQWVVSRKTSLTISNKRSILRVGILARNTNEILHSHVQNVQVKQSFKDRILGVGTICISSAGQSDVEIVIGGISRPSLVVECIDKYRNF
jgi:uncharacterized membrane protein YdbT with pleckstrin-like domain